MLEVIDPETTHLLDEFKRAVFLQLYVEETAVADDN